MELVVEGLLGEAEGLEEEGVELRGGNRRGVG